MGKSGATCLSAFEGRRERLLEWLEGGEVYVSVRSGFTPTAMALQGWLLPPPQPFPLTPAVRNPFLSLLVSPTLCATPELVAHLSPSCSSVTVSIPPVTQQLIALSMPSNEEEAAGADELFSTSLLFLCLSLKIQVPRGRKVKEAGFLLAESCLQCWGMGKSSGPSSASPAAGLASNQGVMVSIW